MTSCPPPPSVTTLVERLRAHARNSPGKTAFRFLGDGENVTDSLTYSQLDAAARASAARLEALGEPGSRAVLAHTPGLDFVVDLLGCWYAGFVAVPVYPPVGRREIDTARDIAAATRPVAVLTDLPWAMEEITARTPDAVVLGPLDRAEQAPGGWSASVVDTEAAALLQFTSGSTGTPRGVVVSHRQLVANQGRMTKTYGQDEHSVVVSWLPLYHDMGLIGSVLHPLHLGATCVLLSPLSFLESPVRWLRALSRFGATISAAPNFAYELAVRKVGQDDLRTLDLSTWRTAINGGEPVRPETVVSFAAHFAAAGFRPGAMTPSYGLAECTLLVSAESSADAPGTSPVPGGEGETAVSCGAPPASLSIVGPDGTPVPDGELGEIWMTAADPSIGTGYWEQPVATAELFAARTADGEGPYLRTGDLGFLAGGRLHIAGRSKDVIVVRGRNHFPQDIESTVEQACPAIRKGCVAAFAVGARLVVVAEVRGDTGPDELSAVRADVARRHGLRLDHLVIVLRGTIPKTSSGKIRRRACRDAYRSGTLQTVSPLSPVAGADGGAVVPADGPDAALLALLGEVLGVPDAAGLPGGRTLAELGMDSLRSVQLQHALQERFGRTVPLEELLHDATVGGLAEAVRAGAPGPGPDPADGPDPSPGAGSTAAGPCPAAGQDTPSGQGTTPGREPAPTASAGQQALWFLEHSSTGGSRYAVTRAARLRGGVDAEVLARAVREVMGRHEALHARWTVTGGRVTADPSGAPVPELVVLDTPADGLDALLAAHAAAPLDPEHGPLFRITLIRPEGQDPVLLLAVHHIAADLWSLGLLLAQTGERYRELAGGADGTVGALAPAPGMSEMVAAEHRLLTGPAGERMRDEWIDLLADAADNELRLPLDRPRPATRTWSGALFRLPFGTALSEQVLATARRLGTTPFAVLLSCHAVLLARLSGERRFVVGVPTAVRPDARSGQVVGYCVNTLPLPLEVPVEGSFAGLVSDTAARFRRALAARQYPLPLIAAAVRPVRDAARGPLFATMFGWTATPPGAPDGLSALAEEIPGRTCRVGGLVLEAVPLPHTTVLADLDVSVAESDGELILVLRYATEVLDDVTVEQLGERLLRVAAAATADEDVPIAALTVLSDEERTRLAELTVGRGPRPEPSRTMADCFADTCAAHPDAPAVVSAARTVTYSQLGAEVAVAAARLAGAAGSGAGAPVGVLLPPEPRFVTALLAALTAGCCVVPLLPAFPDDRLRFVASDAGVAAVLTDRAHAARAARLAPGRPVVVLDDPAPPPAVRVQGPPSAGTPAYVVHTSGTTGTPKGVPITHANVLPLLLWQRERFGLGPGTRLPQTLSLSFDFGLQEVFTTVLFGAALHFPDQAERLSAPGYARFVRREQLTILYLTPTFAAELAAAGVDMPSVRTVVLGGEMLTYEALRALTALVAPDAVFVNGYGPTEASINCSMRFVDAEEAGTGSGIVPVGPPTGRSQVGVLDPWDDPTVPGGFGEVVIGGPGVAAGYLNRPGTEGRAFTTGAGGARRYRTGDLGRLQPGGDLVLLGRLDDQVKIRGFRVEPEEVRAVLLRHPDVLDAVVVVEGDGNRRRLAAGVVPGPGFGVHALRAWAAEHLPGHEVPTRIVPLDTLPRTAHGKLDRARLDECLAAAAPAPARGVPPTRAVERRVAAVWQEVLDVPRVGSHDNFFDLGGHSLLVAPLVSRLEEELGLPGLPLMLLFEFPTVAELAARLEILLHTGTPDDTGRPAVAGRTRRRGAQHIRITFG
ncbi:amino acid adenylation domain-containing protein [Streptomyces sp. NBC_01335]|uniref:non-ribosomal peptide synthetase n=1 Tax=Streptomyces sp. NBC_01335 TaxID=2903828 RepID=UPI002E0F6D07|nr:non-ribosomal peptide synthetase [Streptomyces sp. NBC_01335]WSI68753.1 amino acid adenylation domain-containing protein [Streptomyces sp. NBC_01335]